MNLQLNSFELQIDEDILKKGLSYFKHGYVTDVEDLGNGDYEATVEGTEDYTVRLHIEGNEVTEYECDCPYDWGPVCKHVAAVLFYMQKDMPGMEALVSPTKRTPKEPSESSQMETLLKQLPHDKLKDFLREACKDDKRLRKLFIAKHISYLYPESKELYTQQVEKLVDTYSDRYGFVDYRESSQLGNGAFRLADEAWKCLENGQEQQALYMAEAVVEEMAKVIDHADDSNGTIGGSISHAFEVLTALAESVSDDSLHDELFSWLLQHFEKETMKGWDWYFDLMDIAITMVHTPEEKERVLSLLKRIKPSGESWDWNYRQAQDLMLKLIRKTEDENAAIRFMETHLTNSDFRKELIEIAMHQKDYLKAEQLAQEGIEHDKEEAPGLAEEWRGYLLDIYQATGNREQTIRLTRHFLMHSGRQHPRKYYYDLLKTLIPKEQWQVYAQDLVKEMSKDTRFGNHYTAVSEFYIWEEQWDKLLELLRQYPDFYRIEEAEKYLGSEHAEELATLYRNLIIPYLKNNVGRGYYQTACKYIRRMIKLGARPMATQLVEQLRTTYRNRKALLEELNRI